MKELFSNLSLIHWLFLLFFQFFTVGILVFLFMKWFLRKELRLYRNLKRPVMIITPSNSQGVKIESTEMELETRMLVKNGFFRIDNESTDFRSFNPRSNHCLVVLGYHPDMHGLDEVLTKVKMLQIPLIVFTYGKNINAIAQRDKTKLDSYPLTLYANFQLTLLNHIFTTLATYPYEQK
ncbi:hypothetical protein HUU39_17915 [candidate division KSB1 bacterium]|nr:hypothetical protein [bacterium]NUM67117.1 hypothetical protein [candidate division KSB1 bacterium]